MPEVSGGLTYEQDGVIHNGEFRTITKSGFELREIHEELDFLILCKCGKNPSRLGDLQNNLGEEWAVQAMKGDTKKYEILRDYGKFYWAHRGWDKRKEWDQYQEFYNEITKLLGKEILDLEKKKNAWRIVGDETLIENQKILRYVWIVVPPSCDLNPEFNVHAADGNHRRTKRMVKNLIKQDIRIHVFDSPHEPDKADYTDRILPHTIPLMMDLVRTQIEDKTSTEVPLRIISEGYSNRTSKWGEKTLFRTRYEEKAVLPKSTAIGPNFMETQSIPVRFIPKNGHPLLGYPDAVGAVIGNSKEIFSSIAKKLEPLVTYWTFLDAETLAGGLLSRTNLKNPVNFYKELRALPENGNLTSANQSLESIVNFYSKNLVNDLSVEKFIDFETDPRPPNYQWASERMMEDGGGVESWITQIPEDDYRRRFNIYFSGVSHAARKTNHRNVLKYAKNANKLIEEHGRFLDRHRINKFRAQMVSIGQRFFVFDSPSNEEFEELQELALNNYGSKNDRHLFGSWLLREAQRDGPDVNLNILQLQKDLRAVQGGKSTSFRDTVYLLEMLIDLSRRDPNFLDEALEIHYKYIDEIKGLWGIAAQLKLGVCLHKNGEKIPDNICSLLEKIEGLDFGLQDNRHDNPTVRCLAWGARLNHILGESEKRDRLIQLLRKRAASSLCGDREPLKDSVGVSHACHIMDLEEDLKMEDNIGEEYLELVLDRSLETTKDWLGEKRQKEDHLAPLNLLHR